MYESKLNRRALIIDDSNYQTQLAALCEETRTDRQYGLIPRDFQAEPYGSAHIPFIGYEGIQLMSEKEIIERLELRENENATIRSHIERNSIPVKDQNGTPHCWAYGTVTAFEICRAIQGMEYRELAPDSVAAPINNYRARGGWGSNAVKFIHETGIVPADNWPKHYYGRKHETPENDERRKEFKIHKSFDVIDNGMDWKERLRAVCTASLLGFAAPVAYNWWGHLVCSSDPKVVNRQLALEILNSWRRSYGDNGYAILKGSKAAPDECIAIMATAV